ncbi:MAG TPA: heparinase II/III family protein, partial [Candidatus Glassbacteria bacterium]|nr:heparinase II/III family protein [Candidatus Glassbacteria bacterium]
MFLKQENFNSTMDYHALIHRLRAMGPAEIARRALLRCQDSWRWKLVESEASRVARASHLDLLTGRPLFFEENLADQAQLPPCQELIDSAREIAAGKIPLFGRVVELRPRVDWLDDPFGSGSAAGRKRLPAWSESYDRVGVDVRSIWELNRLQFVTVLARAWQLTGEDEFARAAARHLLSWQEANPYGRTVNWTNALEAAIRSLSILTVLNCLRRAKVCQHGEFRAEMSRLLFLHGEYVAGHLSSPSSGFNHLAGE